MREGRETMRKGYNIYVYFRQNRHHQEAIQHLEKHREDINRYYRFFKFLRPFILLVNLMIVYFIFKWVGLQLIGILVALIISAKEIVQLMFLRHLERRIFAPISVLRQGVEEIARGNYNVRIESTVTNEIGSLIQSFNEMAEKLQESERLKAEYEENRKSLVANISHDLKTPITAIQGYIEGIVDGVVTSPDKTEKYLRIIYQNTVYINKLIDDLFLFSKLDMQKLDFNFEVVPIRGFMRDVMEEFKLELEEKEIDFRYTDRIECPESSRRPKQFEHPLHPEHSGNSGRFELALHLEHGEQPELPGGDPLAHIDRKRIYQAIRNVVGNAVKYGSVVKERTGSQLLIETTLSLENNYLRLDIKDNGPGIPKDKLPHIFERFYRVDVERTKDLMSTGLGLAITRELVEAHRGKITATSVENQGSCFTILLPIAQMKEGEPHETDLNN